MTERRRDPEKAKRAAAHPERPGQDCKAEAGSFMPVVERGHCEAKRDCEAVCPYDVFEVRRIDEPDYRALGALSRFKVWVHGMQTAYTPNVDACRACGMCVVACPEHAIKLVARS